MKLGIIGLPQCGKTTLFNALTGGKKPASQIAGGGQVKINTAIVNVPDQRVDWLSQHCRPKKTTHAKVTFQDIAGVQGDRGVFSRTLLSALSQVEGFVHVVRSFQETSVPHPLEGMDAARDISALEDEFALNDMLTVGRKLQRLQEEWSKGGGRERAVIERELHLFAQLQAALESGQPLHDMQLGPEDVRLLSGFGLLTRKPVLLVLNSDERALSPQEILGPEFDGGRAQNMLTLMAKLEMEIAQLDEKDAAFFMQEYSLNEPGLIRVIRRAYDMLGVLSFFTVSPEEVRAWPLSAGASARRAAGIVHSDMEAGFVRAEVMAFADLQQLGSEADVKSSGKLRLEGKDYAVQDGDILQVRFSPPARK
ncbi:MAG: DUF933 domain-containing protein [Anaerolineales bacterium]|jgi:hypothetical protein|nr:DUF933 domain-containing protein [Anaerolineales bacterium]HJO32936.1 DUF933 domain-containing protein [Anaerolineales bacterium]|tara:strand:+ start:29 stop:1126 length:1098 start_codon:yes stop_codon:yes gene_type:complete